MAADISMTEHWAATSAGPGETSKWLPNSVTSRSVWKAPHISPTWRAYSGCEVWQQDFLKLDLPENYFDGVFANAALFHVPSQELPRVLLELHASLKPGGVLFSSNPHGHNEEGWNGGRYGVYVTHRRPTPSPTRCRSNRSAVHANCALSHQSA